MIYVLGKPVAGNIHCTFTYGKDVVEGIAGAAVGRYDEGGRIATEQSEVGVRRKVGIASGIKCRQEANLPTRLQCK